jgi:hypothetical protein
MPHNVPDGNFLPNAELKFSEVDLVARPLLDGGNSGSLGIGECLDPSAWQRAKAENP